ncbi:hypothetical protein EJ02DRAFT_423875 [Clathrospora elynae]|uniref:Uncharacterized protein n=1 Tax=Clathrospora elynae TaxID=706981 RepID=A0A6A5SPK9_9PLEO|nr:hypothetical protein EJ02DRAFT_423875 [Clathrospora elynae]
MSDPVIKKEESPEASVMATPSEPVASSAAIALAGSASSIHDVDDVKPSKWMSNGIVAQARFDPTAYYGSSPRKYRLDSQYIGYFPMPVAGPPMSSRDPSQSISAMATPRGRKLNPIANITTPARHSHNRPKKPLKNRCPHTNPDQAKMDQYDFGEISANIEEMQYPVPPPIVGMQGQDVQMAMVSRNGFENMHDNAQQVQNATGTHEQQGKSDMNRLMVRELVKSNVYLRQMYVKVDGRLTKLEHENTNLRSELARLSHMPNDAPQTAPVVRRVNFAWDETDGRSRSPSPSRGQYRDREERALGTKFAKLGILKKSEMTEAQKQLQVKALSKAPVPPPVAGLPTPMTKPASKSNAGLSAPYSSILKTPITPGRIGPSNTGISAPYSGIVKTPITPGRIGPNNVNRKSSTQINKRKVHNVDKMMPPHNVLIPMVPLTDTEVIVYFFQSLSRPMVALRLYSRNWGPAQIVDILNEHRDIEGGYLRNTCSVKCTTAIKKGRDKFGEDWEANHRAVFQGASDLKATDLLCLTAEELKEASDYDVRSLTIGLKKHPEQDVDGGIFTKCVKYCVEHDAPYTLANIWQLAFDFQDDRVPVHPSSPSTPRLGGRSERLRRERKQAEEEDDDEDNDDIIAGERATSSS